MGAALSGVALLKWGIRGGTALADYQSLVRRVDAIDKVLATAGEKTSDLASAINGLPERLRKDFLPRPEADLIIQESQQDRRALHHDLERLWEAVRRDPHIRTRHTDS